MEPYNEANEKVLWDTRKERKVWAKPDEVAHKEGNPPTYSDLPSSVSPYYAKDYWEDNLPQITALIRNDLRRM